MQISNQHRPFTALPSKSMFMINCIGSGLYLRQEDHVERPPSVLAAMPNQTDFRQYWVFELVDRARVRHKIVSAFSGLVITCKKNGSVHLEPWRESPKQLFYFVESNNGMIGNYIIRCTFAQNTALNLNGSLVYKQINSSASNHIFKLYLLSEDHLNKTTTVIVNSLAQKALGIVGCSRKQNQIANVTSVSNNLTSHRWMIKHGAEGLSFIQNFNSGMCLDCKLGEHVVQSPYSGTASQLWHFIPMGGNRFYIQSAYVTERFLGISNRMNEEGGQVSLLGSKNEGITWEMLGQMPLRPPNQYLLDSVVPKMSLLKPNVQQGSNATSGRSSMTNPISEHHSNMARSFAGTGRYMMLSGVRISPPSKNTFTSFIPVSQFTQEMHNQQMVPPTTSINTIFPGSSQFVVPDSTPSRHKIPSNMVVSQVRQVTDNKMSLPLMPQIKTVSQVSRQQPTVSKVSRQQPTVPIQPIYIATEKQRDRPQNSELNRTVSIPKLYVSTPNT